MGHRHLSMRRFCAGLALVLLASILLLSRWPRWLVAQEHEKAFYPLIYNHPTPTPVPGWHEAYFDNRDLWGTPVHIRWVPYEYPAYDWGSGAPLPGMPADNFSARFAKDVFFDAGRYAFFLTVDDGGRLYVDGVLVIDAWYSSPRGTATYRWEGALAGWHSIRVEYFEAQGNARVRCFWVNADHVSEWRAEYWANDSLSGAPVLVRNESAIDHQWGTASPAPGVPADGFSARWTRAIWLPESQYVFFAEAGGGIRVWIDKWSPGDELIDAWTDGPRPLSETVYLSGSGWYLFTITYRDTGDSASCRFWWLDGGATDHWVAKWYQDRDLTHFFGITYPPRIHFDWGTQAPLEGMPADNFSARFLRTVFLEAGTYRFTATIDDGCRVWVNDRLVIDAWVEGSERQRVGVIALHRGWHVIKMEYFEATGRAVVQLGWAPDS